MLGLDPSSALLLWSFRSDCPPFSFASGQGKGLCGKVRRRKYKGMAQRRMQNTSIFLFYSEQVKGCWAFQGFLAKFDPPRIFHPCGFPCKEAHMMQHVIVWLHKKRLGAM